MSGALTNVKRENGYKLRELNPKFILDLYKAKKFGAIQDNNNQYRINFHLNLKKESFSKHLLFSSTGYYRKNALLFQMEDLLQADKIADQQWSDESLIKQLVYMDFSVIFNKYQKALSSGKDKGKTYKQEEIANGEVDIDTQLQQLFEDGFKITYEDDETISYVPFDKSGSMSRECRITFINKEIKEQLDKRLLLDIDFSNHGNLPMPSKDDKEGKKTAITVIPSKFYAYRGLYLSDANRVEQNDKLAFDESSVIVISDDCHTITQKNNTEEVDFYGDTNSINPINEDKTTTSGTDEKSKMKKSYWELGNISWNDKTEVKLTPFDGEGIISPAYAHLINLELAKNAISRKYAFRKYNSEMNLDEIDFSNEASSFQIRMPFMKGVLHTVDFNGFYNEFAGNYRNLKIKDFFGIERDLDKAQIIMTESMFKACKWLKKFWENSDKKLVYKDVDSESDQDAETDDPMMYFFKKMKEYNHTLYVGNTNIVLSDDDYTKMNYQFLNTLDMSGENFNKLVESHFDQVYLVQDHLLSDWENNLYSNAQKIDQMSGEELFDAGGQPWMLALSKNSTFINDPKIESMVQGTRDSLVKDAFQGRLSVPGECRFLSGDLLSFLRDHLVKLISSEDLRQNVKKEFRKNRELKPLYIDKFFMAQPRVPLDPMKNYGLLRSPHLSRNEQCALKPYVAKKGSAFDRYFSHLSGVVMVARTSLVPMALSGADFDGDLVKIIAEPLINSAIVSGTYVTDGTESDDKLLNKRLQRKLPIIQIPDTKSSFPPGIDKGTIDYTTIKNTFSNSIGVISNMAIQIGKKEYVELNPKFEGKSAACTVVTGLEIDAAKTGMHPTKNIQELKDALKIKETRELTPEEEAEEDLREEMGYSRRNTRKIKEEKDYFLKSKEILSRLPKYGVKFEERKKNILVKVSRETRERLKIEPFDVSENIPNIDRLPYLYAKYEIDNKKAKKTPHQLDSKQEIILWDFQVDAEWAGKLDKDLKKETKKIIDAWLKIKGINSQIYNLRTRFENTKYAGCVYTILQLQYDDVYSSRLSDGETTVQMALDLTYAKLSEILDSTEKKEKALKRLIELDWPFVSNSWPISKEALKAALINILECSEDNLEDSIIELLTNFNNGGFKLFYYIIKHIICDSLSDLTSEEWEEYETNKSESPIEILKDNLYFRGLYETYTKCMSENCEKKLWENEIIELCRSYLNTIFNGNHKLALVYVYSLKSTDKNRTFLWQVLWEDVLNKHVYYGPKEGTKDVE